MESFVYYHLMFFFLLLSCLFMLQPPIGKHFMFTVDKVVPILLLFIVVIILGSLPIKIIYGDRYLYAHAISVVHETKSFVNFDDPLFTWYINIVGVFLSPISWMYFTALIYVLNHYVFSYRVGKYYCFPLFLMFLTGFFFYPYGTNTIRAGFAASFLLMALSFYKQKIFCFCFILISVGCHFSMIIPSIAILFSLFFNKTKLYLYIWLISIPISALMGHTFENLFSSLSSDDRTSYLLVNSSQTHYQVGFRFDFILYSCIPVALGYYYILKRGIKDRFYSIIYNTYLIANCFWILVIRANFSDRFGYLSWFLYPPLLIYPALKYQLWSKQNEKVALIVFLHGLFTYIMFFK